MKSNQQTKSKKSANNIPQIPFEEELISLIKKARESEYTKGRTIKYLNQYWNDIDLENFTLKESKNAKKFREKVKIFLDSKYDEFDQFAYTCIDTDLRYSWKTMEKKDGAVKKDLIYEVAGSIYKAFEMGYVDKKELKKYTVQRTKILIPTVKAHATYFESIFSKLLKFIKKYACENEICSMDINEFKKVTTLNPLVFQFVWIIENFQE